MRIRIQNELLLLNIISGLLIIVIAFFPSSALRIVLGLPFLLFFPGYTLTVAFFPKEGQLDSIERIALGFGLSIVAVPLIGLVLNYTTWGISLYSILVSVTIFILAISLTAWFRRHRLAEAERFSVSLDLNLAPWKGQGLVDKILSIILIVAILGASGTLVYVIAAPKVGERFTEFYILGSGGKAEGYTKELVLGEESKVTVGIVNQENETVSYRVEVTIDGARLNEIGPVVLHHEDSWQGEVSFMPTQIGESQKVEFLLYKQGQNEAYRRTHLWVDVTEHD